jgi:D-glycero-alpha-D-manno-heptose-7-phosphate kinase
MSKNNPTVCAKAPVRISFAGGGTDFPEYFGKHGGNVVSTTINKYVTVQIKSSPHLTHEIFLEMEQYGVKTKINVLNNDKMLYPHEQFVLSVLHQYAITGGVEIKITSDVVPAIGLGTSSATAIALCGAIGAYTNRSIEKSEIVKQAIHIERTVLKRAGGLQDQYASGYGGLNYIQFHTDGIVSVDAISITGSAIRALEEQLLLFRLNKTRDSSFQQEKLIQRMVGDVSTIEALHQIRASALDVKKALEAGAFGLLSDLLTQNWNYKKISNPSISNQTIDTIFATALQKGAIGGKLLGAGGGGCLLFFIDRTRKTELIQYLQSMDLEIIDFRFETKGFHLLSHKGNII